MRVHHIAIWTRDIDRLSAFYERHFGAKKDERYANEKTGFTSYFLRFDDGASIELMNMASIPENKNDVPGPEQRRRSIVGVFTSCKNADIAD